MAVNLREKPLRHQPGDDCALGETSVLSVGKEALMRVTSNPFYDYMQERINSRIGDQKK
jgi:hypothetical protein